LLEKRQKWVYNGGAGSWWRLPWKKCAQHGLIDRET
jgi:hypothetical protein